VQIVVYRPAGQLDHRNLFRIWRPDRQVIGEYLPVPGTQAGIARDLHNVLTGLVHDQDVAVLIHHRDPAHTPLEDLHNIVLGQAKLLGQLHARLLIRGRTRA